MNDSIDMKTFNIVSTSIKSILNIANSIEDNKVLKNVSIEIENILNSVENKKEIIDEKKEIIKDIKVINENIEEVNPSSVIKPLL